MTRSNASFIPAALALITLLALPVQPTAAAPVHSSPQVVASVDSLWHWALDLWTATLGTPRTGKPLHNLRGKLGGFIDPNGARLQSQPNQGVEIVP